MKKNAAELEKPRLSFGGPDFSGELVDVVYPAVQLAVQVVHPRVGRKHGKQKDALSDKQN